MSDINKMIKWMTDRKGKVTYSMTDRNDDLPKEVDGDGKSFDCSSAVYNALITGGFLPKGTWIGNTDSLFGDLEKNGWKQVKPNSNGVIAAKRGDIFIWGKRGASSGSFGHTGIFYDDKDQIIHCNYGYNGITINDHDTIYYANGAPANTIYRYSKSSTPAPAPTTSWYSEKATMTLTEDIWLRGETAQAGPSDPIKLPQLALLKKGSKVKYDRVLVQKNGHVWIRQNRPNGKFGYLPTGETKNGKRSGKAWGTFV